MYISKELINKLKIFVLTLIISFLFLIITSILYINLDNNIELLKNNNQELISKKNNLVKENKNSLTILKNNEEFLKKNKSLNFINVKDEFEYLNFKKEFQQKLTDIHQNIVVNFKNEHKKTKTYLYEYNLEINFPYINPLYFYKIIFFLEKEWFYYFNSLQYDIKKQKFILNINLYSDKKIKKYLNTSNNNKKKRNLLN